MWDKIAIHFSSCCPPLYTKCTPTLLLEAPQGLNKSCAVAMHIPLEFACFCTMYAPATKSTGSAVTTDEPVSYCTITENYMESLEQQVLFYRVREHKKNTHGNRGKARCNSRHLHESHWLDLHRKWAFVLSATKLLNMHPYETTVVHTFYKQKTEFCKLATSWGWWCRNSSCTDCV